MHLVLLGRILWLLTKTWYWLARKRSTFMMENKRKCTNSNDPPQYQYFLEFDLCIKRNLISMQEDNQYQLHSLISGYTYFIIILNWSNSKEEFTSQFQRFSHWRRLNSLQIYFENVNIILIWKIAFESVLSLKLYKVLLISKKLFMHWEITLSA